MQIPLTPTYSWFFFFAVRMNGLYSHSISASFWSRVPCRISYGLASNLGPTSASWTSLCDVFANTWWLVCQSRQPWHWSTRTYRKEIKSSAFANVMTRLASSLGTGNKAPKIHLTRSPSLLPNPSKIKCGYCSDTVLSAFELTSCRRVTFDNVIESVGPWGRWETMRASGTPLVSWIRIRSVMFCARHVWRRSFKTVFPRFRRIELGNTRRSSY